MASNYGVPTVINQDGVVLDVQNTAVSTVGGGSGKLQKMSPMETMQEVFFEIRDGINQIVETMAQGLELEKERFRKEGLAGQNKSIVSGNTDPEPKVKPSGDGDILGALKEALSGIGGVGMGLLGIAGLIGAYLIFNTLSDKLAKLLAPILEFMGETLIPNLKELNEIITDHPGGYWALLGATGLVFTLDEVFGIKGSLGKLFTSVGTFIRTAFITKIPDFTKLGWAGKINRALYYDKGPMANRGIIPKLTRFFTGLGNGIRSSFSSSAALARIKGLTPQWAKSINTGLFGTKAGPPGSGAVAKAGLIGRVGQIFTALGGAIKGIFTAGPVAKAVGVISRITAAFGRTMRRIGRTVTKTLGFISKISGLSAFLKLGLAFAKAIPIVGQIIMVVQGLFGFVTGAIKGFKTEGIFGLITGGLMGLYDGLIGSFLNLIFDIVGWVLKKFGLEGLGNFFSEMDFTISQFFGSFMNFFYMIGRFGKALALAATAAVLNPFTPGAFKEKFTEVMNKKGESSEEMQARFEAPKVAATATVTDNSGAQDELKMKQAALNNRGNTLNELNMDNIYDKSAAKMPEMNFNQFAQTGGTTNVANTTTAFPLQSTHSDETARVLTEIYGE